MNSNSGTAMRGGDVQTEEVQQMMRTERKRTHDPETITFFLLDIWQVQSEDSWAFIGARRPSDKRWRHHPVRPHDARRIRKIVDGYEGWDLYFTPNVFSEPKRCRVHALPTAYAWCDLDGGDLDKLPLRPHYLWETSPGRYQVLWRWDKREPVADAEAYSRAFAQFSEDGTGWEITKYLRCIGSINHKPKYCAPTVSLTRPRAIMNLKDRPTVMREHRRAVSRDSDVDFDNLPDYRDVQRKYRAKNRYGMSIRSYMGAAAQGKRSSTVAAIAHAYAKEGASPEEIASVVMASDAFQSKWGDSRRDALREVSKALSA